MGIKAYEAFSTVQTPQTEPIPGASQIQNSAGGYVYDVGPWATFLRFLILGSEGGTYYVQERPLTVANARNVIACIAADGKRAVDLIAAVSDAGRAPKNDPAVFALALAASSPSKDTRAYALAALPRVCRIPTHLFHFLTFVQQHRGFGRGLRSALASWYERWSVDQLAHEVAKYQQRDGWSNADVLRLAHPSTTDPVRQSVYRWIVDGREGWAAKHAESPTRFSELPAVLSAVEEAQTATVARVCALIREHHLTREMVPTEMLASSDVWGALLEGMPLTALVRNLGNMSKVGLLAPMSAAASQVVAKLHDVEAIRKARLHPVALLIALKTYASGQGLKGSGTWKVVPSVVDALDEAFYAAFGVLVPTGKRLLFALDVSGSMSFACGGLPISCAEGAAAMALACAKTEREYYVMGFANTFRDLGLTPKMRLDDALRRTREMNFGSTDCSLPMVWAAKENVQADGFVVITDSETYAGHMHPSQALKHYRQKTGIAAREVVVGMTATNFTIADPSDPLALDVVGFDAATPNVLLEFVRG